MKHFLIKRAWLVLFLPFMAWSQGKNQDKIPLLLVDARGKIPVQPDIALVDVGVSREAVEASEAYREANIIMQKVRDTLLKMGIERRDIKTINFSLSPKYEYREGKQVRVGYVMRHTYRVKIKKLDRTGEILDASQAAGATEIGRIVFTVDDPSLYQREARVLAVKNAIEKAKTLAEAAGITLGPIWRMEEVSYLPPIRTMDREASFAKAAGAPAPVEVGQLEVSVSVRVQFEIRTP